MSSDGRLFGHPSKKLVDLYFFMRFTNSRRFNAEDFPYHSFEMGNGIMMCWQ
jgi:hypothetical protein